MIAILGIGALVLLLACPLLLALTVDSPGLPETPRDATGRPVWAVIPTHRGPTRH